MRNKTDSPRRRADRVVLAHLLFLLLFPLSYGLTSLAAQFPQWVEKFYARGLYPLLAEPLSRLAGLCPVSVSELILLLVLPALLIICVVRVVRRPRRLLRVLSGVLALACMLYSVFSLGWALNYSRQPLATTASLPVEPATVDELEALCISLAGKANALRADLDSSAVPYVSGLTQDEILREIPNLFRAAAVQSPWLGGNYAAPKAMLLSTPMAYLGITGIYSPFTFESHVNAHEDRLFLPATAAHESAHLHGFAREDEANYIAYAVCSQSEDTYFAYSGTMLALLYAGNALADQSDRYLALRESYSEGVAADFHAYNQNWKQYEGPAADVHEQINDVYLRCNNQSDGVRSYGRMVDLLLAEKRLCAD